MFLDVYKLRKLNLSSLYTCVGTNTDNVTSIVCKDCGGFQRNTRKQ